MPNRDVDNIIANLPPLAFTPAADAPVSDARWYLVCPSEPDDDWRLASRTADGWFWQSGERLDHDPLVVAALPAPPFGSKMILKNLAAYLSQVVDAGEYDRAAGIIDELADAVRGVRSRPYRP